MSDLLDRINALEIQLRVLESDLSQLRREAGAVSASAAAPPRPETPVAPEPPRVYATPVAPPAPPPVVPTPPPAAPTPAPVYATASAAAQPATPPAPPRKPRFDLSEIDYAALTGPRALAWVGGAVTLLGIVFFFVLAVNRGWVSAELRVALGALVSVGLYASAWWIYKRFGTLEGGLAAAGAGIAGAYATVLAATALYDFVPTPVALLLSAGIAAVGIATALAWNAQITAILGLVGAMLGPLLIENGDPSGLGAVYVAIVFAAAAVVALRKGWFETLAVAGVMCFLESSVVLDARDPGESVLAAALAGMFALLYLAAGVGAELRPATALKTAFLRGDVVPLGFFALSGLTALGISIQLEPASAPAGSIAVAAVLWVAYLAAGVGTQIRRGTDRLTRIPSSLVLFSVSFAFLTTYFCFDTDDVGYALLVVAAVTAAPIALLLRIKGQRNLVTVLWAAALAVLAVAAGHLLGGKGLVFAWAAQGALLAWVAVITKEQRLRLASIAYLALALGYALAYESAPVDLFRETSSPESGILAIVFVSLGAAAFALAARVGGFRPRQSFLAGALVGAVGALYAASFGLLYLLDFEQAEIAITALWAAVGVTILVTALLRGSAGLHVAGLALLGAAVAKLLAFDLTTLTTRNGAWSLLIVGALGLAAGYAEGLYGGRFLPRIDPKVDLNFLAVLLLPAAAVGMSIALMELLEGSTASIDHQGAALVWLGAVYGTLAGTVFGRPGRRDLATLLWGIGAALAALGFAEHLLDGSALILAWSALGAALAVLARLTREDRFYVGSAALVGISLWTALVDTPPRALFEKSANPAAGLQGIAFAGLGVAVLTLCLRDERLRRIGAWVTGGVALYAGSLAILGLFEWPAANNADAVSAAFQRGHTAVSAAWGLVGLALLIVGLRRNQRLLRLGGLALFGLALVKIFLYDLANLSSLARAFSFLAVGALLLVAALLYQRLTETSSTDTARPE